MSSKLSLCATQQALFSVSAAKSSDRLPLDIALDACDESSLAHRDLQELKDKGLIGFDFNLKSAPHMQYVSNPKHMINCVVYYGNAEKGRSCIGFAVGCVNKDVTAIELNCIEKRRDAGSELKYNFLPIVVDAFALYGLYLNEHGLANIDKFVIVGPIETVIPYYKNTGFVYVNNYNGLNVDAMYKEIVK